MHPTMQACEQKKSNNVCVCVKQTSSALRFVRYPPNQSDRLCTHLGAFEMHTARCSNKALLHFAYAIAATGLFHHPAVAADPALALNVKFSDDKNNNNAAASKREYGFHPFGAAMASQLILH